jgi:uncharacterized protein YdaU (DUF1376 family)
MGEAMSKLPMQPWYPDAHLADTAQFTLEEQGAYRLILDHLWIRGGFLKDNDKDIAKLLRISTKKWRMIKPKLAFHLCFTDERITQKRLLSDYNKALIVSRKNAENGRKGGQKTAETLRQLSAYHAASAPANNDEIAGAKHIGHLLKDLKPEP